MFISVITPSLNHGRFLERTIQSVLDQVCPESEHIVIDGGSTDSTLEILRSYPHLRWVSETGLGLSRALNKGFQMARGDVIAWINSDDFYMPGTFAKIADFFRGHPQVSVLVGRAVVVDEKGEFLFNQKEPGDEGFTHRGMVRFWRNPVLPQPSIFFRSTIFKKTGWMDESLRWHMDYDFFLRLSRDYEFRRSREFFSCIRLHPDAGSVHDIAAGCLRRALYRISKRYWDGSHFFSYWLAWPHTAWRAYYDRFVFAVKKKIGWKRPDTVSLSMVWRFREEIMKYPVPALVAASKNLFRRVRTL